MVVLAAKNAMGVRQRLVTTSLVPRLASRLPVGVPVPDWGIDSAPGLPFGAFAYPKVPGRALTFADTAAPFAASLVSEIAGFLVALHSFPVEQALEAGIPDEQAVRAELIALRSEVAPVLEQELSVAEYRTVEAWWDDFLSDDRLFGGQPALVHADFWADNILVDDGAEHVLGVIDFEDAQVWDPARDFATLQHNGRRFATACLEAYVAQGGQPGPDFDHRLQRHWEFRSASFMSLRAALRLGDRQELDDALAKLHRGSLLGRRPRP